MRSLLALVPPPLLACGPDATPATAPLVGEWRATSDLDGIDEVLSLDEDGLGEATLVRVTIAVMTKLDYDVTAEPADDDERFALAVREHLDHDSRVHEHVANIVQEPRRLADHHDVRLHEGITPGHVDLHVLRDRRAAVRATEAMQDRRQIRGDDVVPPRGSHRRVRHTVPALAPDIRHTLVREVASDVVRPMCWLAHPHRGCEES